MARPRTWAIVFVLAACVRAHADEPDGASVEDLLERLEDLRTQKDAAESLAALPTSDSLVRRARESLDASEDFHERIALGYVLASHGEKRGLEVLVDSLRETGHFGYVYLTALEGRDNFEAFERKGRGWDEPAWRRWIEGVDAEEYRARVTRCRLPARVRAAGAPDFTAAARLLVDGGDRAEAARRFRSAASAFPLADAVAEATELADLLEAQAKEDASPRESTQPTSPEERIAHLERGLRDARCVHLLFEGYCSFLGTPRASPEGSDAVRELRALGSAAVPRLLLLLEDRSPTRAVAKSSRAYQDWIVRRYQDVALELLNEILPTPPEPESPKRDYLSEQEPADRRKTIESVRSWAMQTSGKTAAGR
jgi:hypothetical protein